MEPRKVKQLRRKRMLAQVKALERDLDREREKNDTLMNAADRLEQVLRGGFRKEPEDRSYNKKALWGSDESNCDKPKKTHYPLMSCDITRQREFALGKQSIPRDIPDGSNGEYRVKRVQLQPTYVIKRERVEETKK